MEKEKRKKGLKVGRKPKADPAIYRYGIKLNSVDNAKFLALFRKSGMSEKSKFITSIVFNRPIKVIQLDKVTLDYFMRLTNFYNQFVAIGVNYNQTLRAIKTNFGEKRAFALLYKLEKATFELVAISKQVIALTKEYEEKYLKKE